jgi:lipopolysaccharide transport system permease protein
MRAPERILVLASRRQLLAELVRKDFDIRYAGSVLGVLWTQIYPLLLLAVYTFVFSTIFHSAIPNFPLFLFVGIAIYQFFSTAMQLATGSILNNANLVVRVGFPRELVTLSVVLISMVDFAASSLIMLIGAVWYGIAPSWSWVALPGLVLLLSLVCAGTGLALATAAVYLRDVRFFVEVLILLLLFLTPVFYSETAVPESVAWFVNINPLATTIAAYRHAFLDGVWPSMGTWLTLTAAAILAVVIGIEVFDRGQRGFADAL